jgi:hypothetical protein
MKLLQVAGQEEEAHADLVRAKLGLVDFFQIESLRTQITDFLYCLFGSEIPELKADAAVYLSKMMQQDLAEIRNGAALESAKLEARVAIQVPTKMTTSINTTPWMIGMSEFLLFPIIDMANDMLLGEIKARSKFSFRVGSVLLDLLGALSISDNCVHQPTTRYIAKLWKKNEKAIQTVFPDRIAKKEGDGGVFSKDEDWYIKLSKGMTSSRVMSRQTTASKMRKSPTGVEEAATDLTNVSLTKNTNEAPQREIIDFFSSLFHLVARVSEGDSETIRWARKQLFCGDGVKVSSAMSKLKGVAGKLGVGVVRHAAKEAAARAVHDKEQQDCFFELFKSQSRINWAFGCLLFSLYTTAPSIKDSNKAKEQQQEAMMEQQVSMRSKRFSAAVMEAMSEDHGNEEDEEENARQLSKELFGKLFEMLSQQSKRRRLPSSQQYLFMLENLEYVVQQPMFDQTELMAGSQLWKALIDAKKKRIKDTVLVSADQGVQDVRSISLTSSVGESRRATMRQSLRPSRKSLTWLDAADDEEMTTRFNLSNSNAKVVTLISTLIGCQKNHLFESLTWLVKDDLYTHEWLVKFYKKWLCDHPVNVPTLATHMFQHGDLPLTQSVMQLANDSYFKVANLARALAAKVVLNKVQVAMCSREHVGNIRLPDSCNRVDQFLEEWSSGQGEQNNQELLNQVEHVWVSGFFEDSNMLSPVGRAEWEGNTLGNDHGKLKNAGEIEQLQSLLSHLDAHLLALRILKLPIAGEDGLMIRRCCFRFLRLFCMKQPRLRKQLSTREAFSAIMNYKGAEAEVIELLEEVMVDNAVAARCCSEAMLATIVQHLTPPEPAPPMINANQKAGTRTKKGKGYLDADQKAKYAEKWEKVVDKQRMALRWMKVLRLLVQVNGELVEHNAWTVVGLLIAQREKVSDG